MSVNNATMPFPARLKVRFQVDPVLLSLALALLFGGIVILASASIAISDGNFGQPFYYVERQLLAVKNALLIKRQAEASADFAQSMGIMAAEIGRLFGETDLVQTQADWEKAMIQSQTMEEGREMLLETVEDMASEDVEMGKANEAITDEEIDGMIDAEASAEHQSELGKLAGLRAELNSLKQQGEKQK